MLCFCCSVLCCCCSVLCCCCSMLCCCCSVLCCCCSVLCCCCSVLCCCCSMLCCCCSVLYCCCSRTVRLLFGDGASGIVADLQLSYEVALEECGINSVPELIPSVREERYAMKPFPSNYTSSNVTPPPQTLHSSLPPLHTLP